MKNIKKFIIASVLLSSIGLANAKQEAYRVPSQDRQYNSARVEQRENRRDVMELENAAMQQRSKIDWAVSSRAINRYQSDRIKQGFNRILASVERAKLDRRISDQEVRKIAQTLKRNEQDLDKMLRKNDRRR